MHIPDIFISFAFPLWFNFSFCLSIIVLSSVLISIIFFSLLFDHVWNWLSEKHQQSFSNYRSHQFFLIIMINMNEREYFWVLYPLGFETWKLAQFYRYISNKTVILLFSLQFYRFSFLVCMPFYCHMNGSAIVSIDLLSCLRISFSFVIM